MTIPTYTTSPADKPKTENIAETLSRVLPKPELISDHEVFTSRYAIPPGWSIKDFDDEELLIVPRRLKATPSFHDIDSFLAYVQRFVDSGSTIWCSFKPRVSELRFQAILDDHQFGQPDWRSHRTTFEPDNSVEWDTWMGGNKRLMSQAEFATFLEDNEKDITEREGYPTSLQMVELATNFKYRADMAVKSSIRLQDGGVRLEFIDTADDATATAMKLYERFCIAIPVWEGTPTAYRIDARLRFRNNSGKLSFWYELVRPDCAHKLASEELIERVRGSGVPMFMGSP